MIRRLEWTLISFIVAAYLVLAWQYATRTPDWQAPDEPAHYNYVRQIVDEGKLPTLSMGDWNQPYQNALTAYSFAPALTGCTDPPEGIPCPGLETVEYEDHQPPLYYLLQTPVYALTGGDLTAMRMFSALLGAGVVLCTWAVLWVVFPRWPYLALTGAGFVAFLPQHLAILSSVSNDALAELVVGLTLLAAVVYLGNSRTFTPDSAHPQPYNLSPAALGVLVGVALITKTTIYFLAGIAVLAVLLRWRRERWPWQIAARHLAAVIVPALLIGGAWWARNLAVYGGTDFTGLARHDAVTVGQLRTEDYIDQQLGGSTREYLKNFAQTTFHSFWGQFGWMALPMPTNVYRVFWLFTAVVLSGVFLFVWRRGGPRKLLPPQQDALIIFAAVGILVIAAYVLYNRDFVQFQGRYLYPALIPLAFLIAIGLNGWTALFENLFPALDWVPVTAMMGLALFAWYALDTYIVPNLPVW
jgi:4-amino-4-deoxy-L-arabinose transferase-like glycosyltransferase